MTACPHCGFEAETAFKFCPECGSALALAPAPREQRKTVTVLFCDVAGSTALAEQLRAATTDDHTGMQRAVIRDLGPLADDRLWSNRNAGAELDARVDLGGRAYT